MNDDATVEDDGAGQPPWLPSVGSWFIAAGSLLILPRMWLPAALSLVIGLAITALSARRRRSHPEGKTDAEQVLRADADSK